MDPAPKKLGNFILTFHDDNDEVAYQRIDHHVKLFVSVDKVEGEHDDDVDDDLAITFNYCEQYSDDTADDPYTFMDTADWDDINFEDVLGYVDGVPDVVVQLAAQSMVREYCKEHGIYIPEGVR